MPFRKEFHSCGPRRHEDTRGARGGGGVFQPASTAAGSDPQSAPEIIDLHYTVMIFDQE